MLEDSDRGSEGSAGRVLLRIGGMTCEHCVARVRAALEAVEGVVSAEVVLADETADVVGSATAASLIKAVEEHSLGFYTPSPGMVYPALSYLEDHGFASVTVEGNKKRYGITPEGETWLAERQHSADAILAQLRAMGERVKRMNEAMAFDRETDNAAEWTDTGHDPLLSAPNTSPAPASRANSTVLGQQLARGPALQTPVRGAQIPPTPSHSVKGILIQ